MANWSKLDAIMRNIHDSEKREMLGMDNLPIETLVKPIVLDLDRVESFAPTLDEDGSELEGHVDVIMHSGLAITIRVGFNDFFKAIASKKK